MSGGCLDGVSVHGGPVEGWDIDGGVNRVAQHTSTEFADWNRFSTEWFSLVAQPIENLADNSSFGEPRHTDVAHVAGWSRRVGGSVHESSESFGAGGVKPASRSACW